MVRDEEVVVYGEPMILVLFGGRVPGSESLYAGTVVETGQRITFTDWRPVDAKSTASEPILCLVSPWDVTGGQMWNGYPPTLPDDWCGTGR